MNMVCPLSIPVQFFGPGMFNVTRHKRHLFLVLFAHFLASLFMAFIIILGAYTFLITAGGKFVQLKMRFFWQYINLLHLCMDTIQCRWHLKMSKD